MHIAPFVSDSHTEADSLRSGLCVPSHSGPTGQGTLLGQLGAERPLPNCTHGQEMWLCSSFRPRPARGTCF